MIGLYIMPVRKSRVSGILKPAMQKNGSMNGFAGISIMKIKNEE
jgi:hypothetical protein